MIEVRDHEGRIVDGEESPDAQIAWWVVEGLRNRGYDETWIRGWQDMLQFVAYSLEGTLEILDEEEIEEGITVKIKLRRGTKEEYVEVAEADV